VARAPHWVDIGGMSTGFSAATLVQGPPRLEGLQLDQISSTRAASQNEKVVAVIRADNIASRMPRWGTCVPDVGLPAPTERRLEELSAATAATPIYAAIRPHLRRADGNAVGRRVGARHYDGVSTRAEGVVPDPDGSESMTSFCRFA